MSDAATFAGFAAPYENWTKLPHALIDALPLIDSLAEMKVILYTLRHTWGFQEYQKGQQLTLDEYMHGKQDHEGKRTDGGTGMSKPSIISGIRRAIEHGFLDVQKYGRERNYLPKSKKSEGKDSLPEENIHKETEGKTSLPSTVKLLYPESKTSLPSDSASDLSASESGDPLKIKKETERNNTDIGVPISAENSQEKKRSTGKPKGERKPSSYLTDSMWQGIPEEIRPGGKPHYGKNDANAEQVFKANFTTQQVQDFVEWTYATNDWYWIGGKGGVPVIISMNAVLKGIRLSMGAVRQWIADGKPNLTGRAQETARAEKPFDIETDTNNPKNWPFPAKPADYEWYKLYLAERHGITGYNPPQLHDTGRKDNLPAGAGIGGSTNPKPQLEDMPAVSGHGSSDLER